MAEERIALTVDQIHAAVVQGLRNIQDHCVVYDSGQPGKCFALALEIRRILHGNNYLRQLREARRFRTMPGTGDDNLLAETKMFGMVTDIRGTWPEMEVLECFCEPALARDTPIWLPFDQWWQDDIVYRDAARSGAERQTLSRRQFITMMRDAVGAHIDDTIPAQLDRLQSTLSLGVQMQVTFDLPDGGEAIVSTEDGTLPMRISPAAAITRQIAFEVLEAYAPELRG